MIITETAVVGLQLCAR